MQNTEFPGWLEWMEELWGDGERGGDGAQPRVDFRGKELVPGKQQSTSKKAQRVFAQRSVYLAEISSSPSLSPLASGRVGVYQRRTVKGFERFSTLSFSAPPPPFESMGVVSQRQSVNKRRWCKGSDGAEKRESAGLTRKCTATFGKMTKTRPSHCQKC